MGRFTAYDDKFSLFVHLPYDFLRIIHELASTVNYSYVPLSAIVIKTKRNAVRAENYRRTVRHFFEAVYLNNSATRYCLDDFGIVYYFT